MHTVTFKGALALAFALSTTALWADGHAEKAETKRAMAPLVGLNDEIVGQAYLTQGATGVLIHVKVSGLTPGKHGLHMHSHGTCEKHTGFKSAKGHVGKVEGGHGLLNPKGPEAGDIPNIFVGADGTGEMEAYSTLVSLGSAGQDGTENLLDADGSTFIIHENADDHVTQPIGGAGARVACGVIEAVAKG